MPIGNLLRRAACALGFHLVDSDDLRRRKLRAARMGIDLRGGLPCACQRCGAGFWA